MTTAEPLRSGEKMAGGRACAREPTLRYRQQGIPRFSIAGVSWSGDENGFYLTRYGIAHLLSETAVHLNLSIRGQCRREEVDVPFLEYVVGSAFSRKLFFEFEAREEQEYYLGTLERRLEGDARTISRFCAGALHYAPEGLWSPN